MKKGFCLCMILTLGAHSTQAGIKENTYKYASATAKGVATTAKGIGAITFSLVSGVFLGLSGFAGIMFMSPEVLKRVQKEQNLGDKHALKMGAVTSATFCGIAGIVSGYVAYKLGQSCLKDLSLFVKKAGIHIKVKKTFPILPMYTNGNGMNGDVFYMPPRI